MDEKDMKILSLLKVNSKLTTAKIAKRTNLPITTVHNRIKKLEKSGVIKGYTVKIDYKKLGKPITGYIYVSINYSLPSGKKIKQEDVANEIKKIHDVEEVNIVTGNFDIIAKVRVPDVDELNDLIIKKLRNIEGVDKTQTVIVLSSY